MKHIELQRVAPADIEARSMELIGQELGERVFPAEQLPVVKRVIHTTADFEYADNLVFSAGAVEAGIDFALTDISCKYRAMTRFGEELAITVSIRRLSPAKLELGYEMREASTGELKAEGTSGHFFYDRAKGRPVALKKALPEVYRLLEALTTPD